MASDIWKSYWPIFERLEAELCELTFSIAFTDSHLGVHSSRLADLLLRVGSECENVGKSLCADKNLLPAGTRIDRLTFPDVGNAIAQRISIRAKELGIIWPYQSFTVAAVRPFGVWQPTASTNPDWFKAYNSLKHNRIDNASKANVHNVTWALGGLFVLNLWLREAEITQHSEPFNLAQSRILSYSQFFSPANFLKLDSRDGLSGSMSGGNLRSLVFEWA